MSFWDRIKPSTRPPTATNAALSADKRRLTLTWDDGKTTSVSARTLRQGCPCAQCVDEWTHQRTFDPKTVSESMGITEMRPVGNYALAFVFSDGHATGIFNWSRLREMGEGAPVGHV